MSKLMRNRWLRWSLLFGVLSALGVGIYQVQEPEPMCVIGDGKLTSYSLTSDGRRLLTFPWPVQIWDTRTGEEIALHFSRTDRTVAWALSKDRNWFAAEIPGLEERHAGPPASTLAIVDLSSGKRVEISRCDDQENCNLYFSPNGNILARIKFGSDALTLSIFETASGCLLHELAVHGLANPPFVGEELIYLVAGKEGSVNTVVWDTRERRVIRTLEGYAKIVCHYPGGCFWAACAETQGDSTGSFVLWNAKTHGPEVELPSRRQVSFRTNSADGQFLALRNWGPQGNRFEIWKSSTGRQIGDVPMESLDAEFSPEGHFLLICEDRKAGKALRMFNAETMEALWDWRGTIVPGGASPLFGIGSKTLFIASWDSSEIQAWDCVTGDVRLRLALSVDFNNQGPTMRTTPDRASLLVHQSEGKSRRTILRERFPWLDRFFEHNDTTVVFDTRFCREQFRLHGWGAEWALLSEDGHTLVTEHEEPGGHRILRCWDVTACKPLRWPIGIPATLAALCVLFTWWHNRRPTMANNAVRG